MRLLDSKMDPIQMSKKKHCNLCDLPWKWCEHGFIHRESRKKKTQTTTKTSRSTSTSGTKTFPQRPEKCNRCGQRPPFRRYWMCAPCLLKTGATTCTSCKGPFKPEPGYTAKKPRCRYCRAARRKVKGSVWTVSSGGLPGLGKNN